MILHFLKDLDINKYCYGYGRDGSKFDLCCCKSFIGT